MSFTTLARILNLSLMMLMSFSHVSFGFDSTNNIQLEEAPSVNTNYCYITYRASRHVNRNLNLHYGVILAKDEACTSIQAASQEVQSRLNVDGWQLLRIAEILSERPEAHPDNEYYLRY